jgi:hypothetical protein
MVPTILPTEERKLLGPRVFNIVAISIIFLVKNNLIVSLVGE